MLRSFLYLHILHAKIQNVIYFRMEGVCASKLYLLYMWLTLPHSLIPIDCHSFLPVISVDAILIVCNFRCKLYCCGVLFLGIRGLYDLSARCP